MARVQRVCAGTPSSQRGFGIVEIMVGVLIGMLVILAVYNIFVAGEGYRRTAMSAADTQVTGLLTQFTLMRDLNNGGSSIASANAELTKCADTSLQYQFGLGPIRPIPVLITDGGAGVSDSFIVFAGAPTRVVHAVNVLTPTPIGSPFRVQSATGFDPLYCTAAKPCLVIAMDGASCDLRLATAAADPIPGFVQLTVTPAMGADYSASTKVMNLGQNGTAMRTSYHVGTTAATSNTLYSQDLITKPGPAPDNPIASNILVLKAQYGVDQTNPPDGTADCWTSAVDDSPCFGGDYRDAKVTKFDASQLSRIVAVRIGIVVQSDEYAPKDVPSDTKIHLFNCSLDTDTDCQGRVEVTLPKFFRYRTYETVVPLRNAVWNGP